MNDSYRPPNVAVVGTGSLAAEAIARLLGRPGRYGPSPAADPVSVEPTMTGPGGRAWEQSLDALRAMPGGAKAGVGSWMIEAPWAHPVWHSYWLCLIHLRRFDGDGGPAHVQQPGASHEIMLFALDPTQPRDPAIRASAMAMAMMPHNYIGQFAAENDAEAYGRAEAAVRDVVDGRLSPDTDFRALWVERFGDAYYPGARR